MRHQGLWQDFAWRRLVGAGFETLAELRKPLLGAAGSVASPPQRPLIAAERQAPSQEGAGGERTKVLGRPVLAVGRGWEGLGWKERVGREVEGGELGIWHKALEQGTKGEERMLETSKGDGERGRGEEQGRELRTGELELGREEAGGRLGRGEGGSVGRGREGRSAHGSGTWQGRAVAGSRRRAARTSPG